MTERYRPEAEAAISDEITRCVLSGDQRPELTPTGTLRARVCQAHPGQCIVWGDQEGYEHHSLAKRSRT